MIAVRRPVGWVADIADEQICLPIWREVRHNLGRRNTFPSFIKPREPRILWMTAIGRDNLEIGFNDIAGTATRSVIFVRTRPCIGALQVAEKVLIRSVRPLVSC